jgi:hypothetical protein
MQHAWEGGVYTKTVYTENVKRGDLFVKLQVEGTS